MLFLLIFIAVPIIEIAAFIKVGEFIGLWPTIACVILTAIIGTFLLRQQGLSVLRKAQGSLHNNQLPVDSVVHGAFLLVAGALLLTPGFFTDAVGFILLIPPARTIIGRFIWNRLKDKVEVHTTGVGPGQARPQPQDRDAGPIIEGEAREVDNHPEHEPADTGASDPAPADPNSPWKKQ